jgi:hypothetical protein
MCPKDDQAEQGREKDCREDRNVPRLRLDFEYSVNKNNQRDEQDNKDPHHDGEVPLLLDVDGLNSMKAQTNAIGQSAPRVSKLHQDATLIALACGCFLATAIFPGRDPITTTSETKRVMMIPKTTKAI